MNAPAQQEQDAELVELEQAVSSAYGRLDAAERLNARLERDAASKTDVDELLEHDEKMRQAKAEKRAASNELELARTAHAEWLSARTAADAQATRDVKARRVAAFREQVVACLLAAAELGRHARDVRTKRLACAPYDPSPGLWEFDSLLKRVREDSELGRTVHTEETIRALLNT